MTSTKPLLPPRLRGILPLATALPLALLLPGCATDPNAGAPSTTAAKVNEDPCARSAAAAASGAGAGDRVEQRRCALYAIAKDYGAEMNVTPVIVPKGDLPPAADVAMVEASPASATPFAAGADTATVGLSVTLRDNGRQFLAGSDKLTPEADKLFRTLAEPYSYARLQARLSAASTDDDKAAVEALKSRRVLLVGHTDDTGSTTENANLSERRAAAVARLFQSEGVPSANLYYQGAGETLPIADNHTEAGRAANRRIEIVDFTDDAALHKFLASRRQTLAYYRASDVPVPDVPAVAPVPAKGKRGPKANAGFIDFGGAPAATPAGAPDFAAGTEGGDPKAGAHPTRPIVPACTADRPRAANGVKALATQKDLPLSDYVPGLYNSSWSDTVNGNLVGLISVDVARDGGAAAGKPTLFIWKNYNPKKKMPPADFQASPDVNIYRASHAILYRVFVGGPMKCMDVWFPYTDTGESRNSNLFYDRQQTLYVTTFELKSLSAGGQ